MTENYRNWYRLAIAFWILLLSAWFAGVVVSIQKAFLQAAETTEKQFLGKARGISSNNVKTNIDVGVNEEHIIANSARAMQYEQDVPAPQSIQYSPHIVDHTAVEPTPFLGSNSYVDSTEVQAHGVVTRLVV